MNTFFKFMVVAIILIFASSVIRAQDEYYKFEGFGGYSYMNLDRGVELDEFSEFGQNRVNSHGFNGSVTFNFRRYWGAKFDVSLHSHGEDFPSVLQINPGPPSQGIFKVSQNDYQYMGGVQFKDNSKDGPKFKPFAHVLLGVADQKFSIDRTSPDNVRLADVHSTDFAMKFGAGIDLKVAKNIDVRVIQFDFNPIWRGKTDFGPNFGVVDGVVRTNFMLTFGVAFH
jgi:opacity protein-like surface antigen